MACAIVHDPRIILLDEPTVGVDPQSRNHIFDNIEALRDRGCTVLYTTHYMEEAQRLCDRVAIIDQGRLLALESVDTLLGTSGGRPVIVAELGRLPADTSSLPGTIEGNTLRVETDDPMTDIAELAGLGLDVVALRVDSPNLETVFLNLTGRSLRD